MTCFSQRSASMIAPASATATAAATEPDIALQADPVERDEHRTVGQLRPGDEPLEQGGQADAGEARAHAAVTQQQRRAQRRA